MALVLEARDVSKRFYLRHNASGELKTRVLGLIDRTHRQQVEEFWALRGVTLRVRQGEAVGLIGRNGSGKSTFLKIVAGIHRPTSGQILAARGARIGSMIELGTGFHPELTGQENVMLNMAIHGLTRADALAIYDAIVAYAGLRHFMDVPLKSYSSGMHMRLGFAIAANLDPDVLLLDEIFAVGDEDFQKQCMGTLKGFQDQGKTILFVSHSAAAVQAICRRAVLLDHGRLLYDGDVDSAFTEYRHLTSSAAPEAMAAVQPAQAAIPGDPDLAWHRLATGGRWTEEGAWTFDFLRHAGLRPDHYVLDMGCGSLASATRLLPYMDQSHYWGFEKNVELYVAGVQIELPRAGVKAERGHFLVNDEFDLTESPYDFDFAIAPSLFRRLTLNSIGRCVAGVLRKLKPGGRFFAAFAENTNPSCFEPVVAPDGTRTYSDREPFHYTHAMLAAIVESLGARVERVDARSHPRGDTVLMITRGIAPVR